MATVNRPPFWVPRPSDDLAWNAAPVHSPIIAFLTKQKIYGAGGQVPPFRPNFTYDDASFWLGAPVRGNAQLYPPPAILPQAAFWVLRPDDSSTWNFPQPWGSWPLRLLTEQKMFGLGGQVLPSTWDYNYDEAAPWFPVAHLNPNLYPATAHNPFSNRLAYWYSYDDPWKAEPINSGIIQLLTQGGKPPQFHPNFTIDDPSIWQGAPVQVNISLNAPTTILPQATFFTSRPGDETYWQWVPITKSIALTAVPPSTLITVPPLWVPRPFDEPTWNAKPISRNVNLISVAAQAPFTARQPYFYSEDTVWQGVPVDSALLHPLLTAGGKVAPRLSWNWTLDDPSIWQGAPLHSFTLPMLTVGGQVPPSRWNFNYDEPAPWWPFVTRNAELYPPVAPQNPFSNRVTYWYSEDSLWQGVPTRSQIISLLTVGGQPPQFRPNFTYDDPAIWQGSPIATNVRLFPFVAPFSNRQNYWYSEDAWWTGRSIRSATLAMLTTPQVAPRLSWSWGLDSGESYWQGLVWPPERNLSLLTQVFGKPLTQPAVIFGWGAIYDAGEAPGWVGQPIAAANTVNPIPPPIPGHFFEWLIRARRRGRR